ncbi:MAG: hypothetical protein NTX82_03830 [Candidatus Parcubacteria bacterium]|nr:hypothetical protein [Candidatus Parcubacteria bacterium]
MTTIAFFFVFIILTCVAAAIVVVGFIKVDNISGGCGHLMFGVPLLLTCGITAIIIGSRCGGCNKIQTVVNYHVSQIKIEGKIKDLSSLRQKLTAKRQEILQLKEGYQNDINSLSVEIRTEQRANNIQTYDQAQQYSRISYDLSLICRKKAYISKLVETEKSLQQGANELEFLEREAIDDQKLLSTLNNQELENLVAEINAVIAKYLPEAGELAIEVDPKSMQTPEQIWNQVNSGN